MKTNIDYYPHKSDSHLHPKFKMLRSLYSNLAEGWAAEGRFWALNNMIARAENCKLDLSKKRNMGVVADELSLSLPELSDFLANLVSEDVELIVEIEPQVYTTGTVQETYQSVVVDRENARKRKKSVKISGSDEKDESSPELIKSSPEPNNKVNRSEVNRSELKESEVKGKSSLTFFSEDHFKKIKELFLEHTKISDPNKTTHIEPVLKFFSQIPENMTERDVENCISEVFTTLDPSKGVRIDLLCTNIQQKITAKHEKILKKNKNIELNEAKNIRDETEKDRIQQEAEFKRKKIAEYKSFYDHNSEKFTIKEKTKLLEFFTNGNWMQAGEIIEPKLKELEEIKIA